MTRLTRLRDLVEAAPLVDTHEHLFDESTRLAGSHPLLGCNDWSVLLSHYVCDDLRSAGLPREVERRFFADAGDPTEKFRTIEPWWARVRLTGYGQALRLTVRELYGETDLTTTSVPRIAERFKDLLRPGCYADLLRGRARIEHCHVDSFEHPVFHLSEDPGLLAQDINISALASPIANPPIEERYGEHLADLDAYCSLIVSLFDSFGPHAMGVKTIMAYGRRLDFDPVDRRRAERAFRRAAAERWAPAEDIKAIEDFLLRFCVEQAGRHGLPVKLHTGYHSGTGRMRLSDVAPNASDLAELVADFPDVRFVAFHIGYPYQHEFVALAKHFPNLSVDMCWAWIVDPVAAGAFLRSFVAAAPLDKLYAFGGDFVPVELVLGHAMLARRWIARSLDRLIEDEVLEEEEAPAVVDALTHGNALAAFGAPKPGVSSSNPKELRS